MAYSVGRNSNRAKKPIFPGPFTQNRQEMPAIA